jgi:hypothetical protein
MKYSIIKILLILALILLFSAFIFPFLRYESLPSYYVTFFWIWGVPIIPIMIYEFILLGPFWLISGGIIVEILFLLKSSFIIRENKMEIEIISRSWKKRGIHIIVYELFWFLHSFFLFYIRPSMYGDIFFNLYIELPIFFPLVSGILLIIARMLSHRLDYRASKNDYVDSQWLEKQHFELKRSIQEIATEQNVSMITIKKYIKKINRK